jgi:hypothetical protein
MVPCDFFWKSDAPGAVDTSIHVGYHQRTDVFILDCSLVLVISPCTVAIEVGIVLEVAFSSLIANRAIEWMIRQQEFHDSTSRQSGNFWIRSDLHGWGNLRAAGGNWLRRFLDLDKAHPAVACYFESFMIAEPGYFDTVFLGCLEDREVIIDLVWLIVDKDLNLLGGESWEMREATLQLG